MNWKEIQSTCPKAFGEWAKVWRKMKEGEIDQRDLYEHFDTLGIYLSILKPRNRAYFCWEVDATNGQHYYPRISDELIYTRTGSETLGFQKAFEIRGQQLNNGK